MVYPIGIDLGTTNSVACVWCQGTGVTVPIDGKPILPSAISVRPDGTVLIGQPAKARAMLEPEQSITSAKRYMGDGKTQWQIADQTHTPITVSGQILSRLKAATEMFLGEPVQEAVITVPAYFNNNQKRDTKLAGEAAGLRVLQLLPEPTAAAISYGLNLGKDQTLLVYDLGGGTFDVSILKVKGNQFQVIAVDGDFHLGGDDFDLLLVEYLIGQLQQRTRSDLSILKRQLGGKFRSTELRTPREMLVARQQLKEAAEQAKIELSQSQTTQIAISNILGTSLEETISLDTYNSLIAPLVDRTLTKIRDVLKAARLSANDIDRVLLVGGSTRNRLVRQRVAEAVKEPFIPQHVDEAVAQGAAIAAASLLSPEVDLAPIELQNVTPFSLGVRAAKGQEVDFFKRLISKNSPIPAIVAEEFTTRQDNQKSVDIAVFQGEQALCRENTFVGGFHLDGIPPAPAEQPQISVQFRMDSSDLLTVTATCSHLRHEQTLDVNLVRCEDEMLLEPAKADIFFLIDTSGSMSGELSGVQRSCLNFAQRVMEAGIDCRLGLMDFDKPCSGNAYKWDVFGPMQPTQFPQAIAGLKIGRLGGCGCYIGEPSTIPVIQSFVKAFPQSDRLKIGILISDEVGNDIRVVAQLIDTLKQAQVCLYVVGVGKSCHEKLASQTGGQFWNIHQYRNSIDFSSLLDAIAVEITHLALK